MTQLDPLQPRPSGAVRQSRQSALVAVLVASVAVGGLIAFTQGDTKPSLASPSNAAVLDTPGTAAALGAVSVPDTSVVADPTATTVAVAAVTDSSVAAQGVVSQDLDESAIDTGAGCLLSVQSVRLGATGDSVTCLQGALSAAGYYTGAATGTFDEATNAAVKAMQTDRDLFVDGIVGRESALSLKIWPDEEALVIHTPAPPAGAKDSLGFPLSSVASTGSNAPPLPPNSGIGKRLVYDRAGQRVWAVAKDGTIIRSWLVSGSKYSNETPGTHEVYSKSEQSTAWNGKAILPHMVRWLKTDIGAIGFHGIPIHVSDGTVYQTEAELGTRLSGGCQRQANRDADFVWAFADIGTPVIVI